MVEVAKNWREERLNVIVGKVLVEIIAVSNNNNIFVLRSLRTLEHPHPLLCKDFLLFIFHDFLAVFFVFY